MKVGDMVRFRETLPGDELGQLQEVVEVRGDRVLVRPVSEYWRRQRLCPTQAVCVSDVEVAKTLDTHSGAGIS